MTEAHPAENPNAAPVVVRVSSDGHDLGVDVMNEDGVVLAQVYLEYEDGEILAYLRPMDSLRLDAVDDPQAIVLVDDVEKSLARLVGPSGRGGIPVRSASTAVRRFPSIPTGS